MAEGIAAPPQRFPAVNPASAHAEPSAIPAIERAYWPAVMLAFAVAIALRTPTFGLAWVGAHNAWGGAFYSTVARNFVRYGYCETGFAPVVSTGIVDPGQFEVYFHHPALSMWLTGLSFHVFGVHEWAARLLPLVFSLLTMALVFVMARATLGKGVALVAVALFAVLPVDAYYGTHLDPYGSMAIFLTTAAVEAYRRWIGSREPRHYALCAAAIVLGCLTSWYTYFIVPGILLHAWFTQRERRRDLWPWLAGLPALTVGVFALFMLHRTLAIPAGRPETFQPLAERLLIRTVELPMDRGEILIRYLRHIWTLYSPAFVALAAAWLALVGLDLWRRRVDPAQGYIAILLSFGFLYGLAFPGHLIAHDYFVRAYAPGIAIAGAVVVLRATRGLPLQAAARLTASALLVAAVALISTVRTNSLYAADNREHGVERRNFAQVIAAQTGPRDRLLLPSGEDRILAYYLDRPITFGLDTPEKLEAAITSMPGPHVVVIPARMTAQFSAVTAYLRQRYPERQESGLTLFGPAIKPQ
jgi:4-amino-4-deoxy-L-arabinose transferase-like glycosyltransferase